MGMSWGLICKDFLAKIFATLTLKQNQRSLVEGKSIKKHQKKSPPSTASRRTNGKASKSIKKKSPPSGTVGHKRDCNRSPLLREGGVRGGREKQGGDRGGSVLLRGGSESTPLLHHLSTIISFVLVFRVDDMKVADFHRRQTIHNRIHRLALDFSS